MKPEMYKSMYETESYHWYFKAKREIVLALLDKYIAKKSSVVDLGCGCGLMLNELVRYGNVTGIDSCEEALEYCRRSFDGDLINGNLEELNIKEKFDCAVLLDVLEHIEKDGQALGNIYEILKHNGMLILTVPADMRLWSHHDENCMHFRRYTKEILCDVLERNSFKVDFISYYNFNLYPIVLAVRKAEKFFHIKNHGSNIEYGFKPGIVNEILYRIFVGEKKKLLKKKSYKRGVSLICIAQKEEKNEK